MREQAHSTFIFLLIQLLLSSSNTFYLGLTLCKMYYNFYCAKDFLNLMISHSNFKWASVGEFQDYYTLYTKLTTAANEINMRMMIVKNVNDETFETSQKKFNKRN